MRWDSAVWEIATSSFPDLAAGLGADHFLRGKVRARVEPAHHRRMAAEAPGLARRVDKDRLRHFARPMVVAPELPEGRRIHQIEAPLHFVR